ncbi:MAG: hypothetical protein FD138_1814 [Planctomycetota bacterium]|nr:MAG: hypothetical protein FD138_1814 [Planctomycetota bacterium]
MSDFFAGVEILRQQSRGHDHRVAGVREAFPGRVVRREFFRGIEQFDAGQIANRVGVLGIAEPPQHDWSRIAGTRKSLGVEIPLDPAAQLLLLSGSRLRLGLLWRHFVGVEHLDDLLPDARPLPHIGQCREAFEVQFSVLLRRRMAFEAKLLQHRLDVASVLVAENVERDRLSGDARSGNAQDNQPAQTTNESKGINHSELPSVMNLKRGPHSEVRAA